MQWQGRGRGGWERELAGRLIESLIYVMIEGSYLSHFVFMTRPFSFLTDDSCLEANYLHRMIKSLNNFNVFN